MPILQTEEAPPKGFPPYKVVILTNLASTFTFAPDLEPYIYSLIDLPFIMPRSQKDQQTLSKLYLKNLIEAANSDYSIILMNYNFILGQTLEAMRVTPNKPNAADWLILSFFHNDSELTEDITGSKADLLGIKFTELETMLHFPFIKKIEIPYDFQFTFFDLSRLLKIITE